MSDFDVRTLTDDDLRWRIEYHRRAEGRACTYGPCACNCGGWGRGGGVCRECAEKELQRREESTR